MQSATARSRSDRAGSAFSVMAAAADLALLALGAAILTREAVNLLDQDVRWGLLLAGSAAAVLGGVEGGTS